MPLTSFERPMLDLRNPVPDSTPTRGRAIAVQNVNLTAAPSDEIDPIWSLDGTKIYFASNGEDTDNDGRIDRVRPDGTYHIWVMNPDGSGQRQLTFDPGNQVEPALSPNGLRLAYASNEAGDYDIYLMTLPSGPKKRLALGGSDERQPTWSAGGDKVAFASDYQTGIPKIWSMNADGTLPQMLSSAGPNEDSHPRWSPDGKRILFQSNGVDSDQDGRIDGASPDVNIWTMSYFGSEQTQITGLQLTAGYITDKDPRWSQDGSLILFASDRADTDNDGIFDATADFNIYYLSNGDRETATSSPAVRLTQRSATEFNPLTENEEMPTLFPHNYLYNPKIAFVSDQTGDHDIWITSIDDITDPRLEELPTVTPRQTIPGETVTITARVSDQESGVQAVYAQIRDPDDRVTDALGQDHKVYFVQPDNTNPALDAASWYVWSEVDCHQVDAQTYAYRIPRYRPGADTLLGQPPDPGWLRLYDDGQHGDGAAGDGVYGNTWRTPTNAPSDFYLDIIAYDNAGNWKMYDGVWGFTTQQFTATRGVLLVMDYAHGQKFMYGERGNFQYEMRYFPTWFPVESHYTRNPTGMSPFDADPAVYANNIVNLSQLGGVPPPAYALSSYAVDTFRQGLETENYDLWRVICRGRINPDVLAAYMPRQVPQPDFQDPYGAERLQLVAERCVFWVSPYSGNLWVGDGTIVDADTQVKLVDFLNKGGRLVVTGQDVAWALTRGGTASSPLLERMGVQYSDDAPAWTVPGFSMADDRLFMNASGGAPTSHPGFGYWGEPGEPAELHMPVWSFPIFAGSLLAGIDLSSTSAREQANHTDTDAAGNQYWIDAVTPIAPAETAYTYNPNAGVVSSDGVAAVRRVDNETQARSLFFAFGLEGVNREYFDDNNLGDHCHNVRNHLVHNAICWLRTGTIYGKVIFTAGLAPAKDALVQAYLGNTLVGQARTRADGTYEIQGLPPAVYRCVAVLPGFSYDHAKSDSVHGAGRREMNFHLSEAPPGSISGRVTEADGTTAIAGASVTATLQGQYKGETIQKSVQSDQFGAYTISDLPTGLYEVKATAEGFAEQTYSGLVTVNAGAETANINFIMGGVPGGVTGTVTRESDNSVVAGATVELRRTDTLVAQTVTDDNGRFTFSNIGAGTYEIHVTGGAGILPTMVTVVVQPNTQVRRNVVAKTPPPAQIAGLVTDSAGNPVAGVRIEAYQGTQLVKSVLTGDVVEEGGNRYNYKLTGLAAGQYDVRASKGGFSGGSTRVTLQESQQLFNVNFTLESLHVFSSGLSMVSTPYDYSTRDPGNLLGLATNQVKIAHWVGTRYAYYPEAPADRFRNGAGYFLLLDKAVSLTQEGTPIDTSKPKALRLTAGWNMIGNPFPFAVNWFDAQVQVGAETISLNEAISRDLIKNALWTYSNGEYRLAFQLMPWEGYWVKATQDLTVLIPNVAARSAQIDPYRIRRATEDGWTLQLVASAGNFRDASNYLGVATQAREEYDPGHDVLEAPPTGMADWVQLTFPHRSGWGHNSGDYAVDIRSRVAKERVWEFEVSTSLADRDVTLTWPNVGQLPKGYTAMLEDVDAGARRLLRSTGFYTFRSPAQGGARRFRLRISKETSARLAVSGLKITPTRAGGSELSFDLSEPATVRVQILGAGGRLIREVSAGQARAAGVNSVYWDGRDSRGVTLGYGLFLYQVEAVAEDGRTVREMRPFVNVR
ncbi:MAG: hypothetical protein GX774_12785 [Armatimonadetes bacterium]|nr:hypothetical protein [Armatimonadota bacterium]